MTTDSVPEPGHTARHADRQDPVDVCLQRVHTDLVAAAAWDLGDTDETTMDAAEEQMEQLRRHLHSLPVEVLTEALILARWDAAYEVAAPLVALTQQDIERLGGQS